MYMNDRGIIRSFLNGLLGLGRAPKRSESRLGTRALLLRR